MLRAHSALELPKAVSGSQGDAGAAPHPTAHGGGGWVLGAGSGRGKGVLDHLTAPFGPSLGLRVQLVRVFGGFLLSSFEEHRWTLSFKSFEKCYVCDVFLTLLL